MKKGPFTPPPKPVKKLKKSLHSPKSDHMVIEPFKKVVEKTSHPSLPGGPIRKKSTVKKQLPEKKFPVKILLVVVSMFCLVVGGVFLIMPYFSTSGPDIVTEASLNENLVIDDENLKITIPDLQPKMIELSGDPLFIQQQEVSAQVLEKLPTQSKKAATVLGTSADIWYLNDVLLASNVNLMSNVPINQENLAFFRQPTGNTNENDVTPSGDQLDNVEAFSKGTRAQLALEIEEDSGAVYALPSRGTSVAYILSERETGRSSRTEVVNKFLTETRISEFLESKGFNLGSSMLVEKKAKKLFQIDGFIVDDIVAVRGHRLDSADKSFAPTQISFYKNGTFTGTLARTKNGEYTRGEDPWFSKPLFKESSKGTGVKKHFRLLDAIYSAATRNEVPRSVIGEAILLMSKSFDLKVLAKPGETVEMVYASEARDRKSGFGKLLYIGINRKPKKMACFVFRLKRRGAFECSSGKGAAKTVKGMFTPVNGVLTSRFGPRMHPILKKMKMHGGVDWAAPTGTPIRAAFNGKITFAGVKGGFGKFVKISHGKGRATGYAHMNRFSKLAKARTKVRAGQIIGFVGTTGRSTGPHLHFVLYRNGRPTDPLGNFRKRISSGGAVSVMVNRIVRIESAGNPNAKNPLSTATGLGQFIESTWMRMIRQHRPDILKGRSRAQVLALRTDPELALEMTTKLTQGNARYLRSIGQVVTPGNLYLAHFLGPQGAAKALRAAPDQSLLALFGAGVVKANPFLRDRDAQWVISWASRKMNRKSRRKYKYKKRSVVKKYATSKSFLAFKAAILNFLQS